MSALASFNSLVRRSLVSAGVVIAVGLGVACTSDETTTNPATVDAGTDSGGTRIICGAGAALCAGNEWCAYELVGSCGKDGQRGTCTVRPPNCATDCPAVCGCDGKIYCNACEAQAGGTDVDKARGCLPGGGEILAFALPGDPAKVAVLKKDEARSLCVRLTLVARLGSRYGLDVPSEWGVDGAEATNDPADCSVTSTGTLPTPKGANLGPVNGQGRVTFSADRGQAGKYPCSLSIAARLQFEPSPSVPWVPTVEALSAQNVNVAGGCP